MDNFVNNVVTAIFANESEGIRAFSDLKNNPNSTSCVVPQMALVKKQNDHIVALDSYNALEADDPVTGGLIGLFVGIIGGPLGMLLSGSIGALIGGAVESHEDKKSRSLVEHVSDELGEGMVAIIALAQESSDSVLNAKLEPYGATIFRTEASIVAQEVEDAKELQKELAKKAKHQMRANKKEARHERHAERKAERAERWEERKELHAEHKAERHAEREERKAERAERKEERKELHEAQKVEKEEERAEHKAERIERREERKELHAEHKAERQAERQVEPSEV